MGNNMASRSLDSRQDALNVDPCNRDVNAELARTIRRFEGNE